MKKGKEVFIAKTATVIGDVELGDECSVWFGAVIRGDSDKIRIGDRTNIQDNCIVHVDEGVPVSIGKEVVVGHCAIIHGATIGDNTLIGMRATVMNHAKVGKFCVIGAHALVTEGMVIPDFSVVMGVPAKIVKQTSEEMKARILSGAKHYVERGKEYLEMGS
ncbi:MAG: carbonic anhydrase/acetyltransferase-like protein (isoleucine patch superfamily) [Arenicella sp.]|jgi:carbonic anhydrase/acetyltransferase-like protein (isoleucine patch superfamily)